MVHKMPKGYYRNVCYLVYVKKELRRVCRTLKHAKKLCDGDKDAHYERWEMIG